MLPSLKRGNPVLIALFLAVAAVVASAPSYALAQTAGTVSVVSGVASLKRGTATSALAPGATVDVGDRVITGPNGHVIIVLTDKSRLELGASSNLAIDQQTLGGAGGRAATRVSLFSGVLRSFVQVTAGPPNFQVHTPNAVAAARGTRFDTAFTQNATRPTYGGCHEFTDVSVYKGVVALSDPHKPHSPAVMVSAGYEATVPCFQSPTEPGPLGMTGAMSFGTEAVANSTTAVPPSVR